MSIGDFIKDPLITIDAAENFLIEIGKLCERTSDEIDSAVAFLTELNTRRTMELRLLQKGIARFEELETECATARRALQSEATAMIEPPETLVEAKRLQLKLKRELQ